MRGQAEIKEERLLKEAFDLHDHEGKGEILAAELGSALRSVGKRLTEEHVAKFTKEANDKGGKVKFDAFLAFVQQVCDRPPPGRWAL